MARLPLAHVPERLRLYAAGLAESRLDGGAQRRRLEQAALWRFVHVAESQRQAEDELMAALEGTRGHMVHARATHNPPGFEVPPSRVNPWNDPRVPDEAGARHALDTMALCGTERRVAEQVAELRDAGVHHVLCQLSTGYLPHASILESTRRFGEGVLPRFRA
jgi:alkanesulfonate monooxygenase SsuD/methylene tetrahydromethanopterin reductase-like flavin-dependent oxidoreductase (luciferase family)